MNIFSLEILTNIRLKLPEFCNVNGGCVFTLRFTNHALTTGAGNNMIYF